VATIFKIAPKGKYTTLHNFNGLPDGGNPLATRPQAPNGKLYGTASDLGNAGGHGKVGAAVRILGTDLTGATSVTFNGNVAKFKIISKSETDSNVRSGATTGTVEVTTKNTLN
jgi:hypothetical protein